MLDFVAADDAADRCCFGIECWLIVALHGHGGVRAAELQLHIDGVGLFGNQLNVVEHFLLEAGLFDDDGKLVWRQGVEVI